MTDRAQVATFLQGLTGLQPLIILLFLGVGGAAQTMAEMRKMTGKSDDALQPALDALEVKGWVTWQAGEHGRRSYLPGGSAFFALLGQSLFLPEQNPLLPDSGATTTTLINNKQLTSGVVVEAAAQNPLFADSVAVCKMVGIGEPKASKLAAYPWVTPDFIREHVAALGDNDKIGLAILRIENNEAPPRKRAAVAVVESYAQQQLAEFAADREPVEKFCTWQDDYRSPFCGQPVPSGERYCSLHGGDDD